MVVSEYRPLICFIMFLMAMHQTHLFKGDLGRVDEVGALSLVLRMLLVPENEGDVCGGAVGGLVPLPGEGDLGSRFPAFLYHHIQHLLFCSQGAAVWVEAAAGNLHMLGAALHHLLQGHQQVVHHHFALQAPRAFPQATLGACRPAHVAEGEPSEGVEEVVVALFVAKEDVEVVRAIEEGGEGGVGVAVEIAAENVASVFKA